MIRVRFTTSEFNAETQQWVKLPVAELIADGEDVRISGPRAEWISPDIAIIDPETTHRVTRTDGAERWAQLLPFAYRSGDLDVEVTEVAAAEPVGAAFHYSTAA
ncbi:MAG TPA: hypothetical protein VIJ50_08295 [Solirubrobacteraceae bacterium]|jgi:hypothetical protein